MKASTRALSRPVGVLALIAALAGCALAPVQDRTLVNGQGGSITCKQTGSGLISGPAGKSKFDACVQDAQSKGYK